MPPVFRPYPNIQQHHGLSPALLASAGGWHWDIQEEPFLARRRNITLAATGGEGYIGVSQDGTTYSWYAGPLGADGRTLTAVASEAAAQAAPFALPSDGRVDLPAMADARFVKLGHRATAGSYILREFYARRLVQTDDLEAESVTAIAIRAGTITADRMAVTQLSAIAADLGTITAGTISGTTIYAGGVSHPVTLDANGIGLVAPSTSVFDATRSVDWFDAVPNRIASVRAYYAGGVNLLELEALNVGGRPGEISLDVGGTRTGSITMLGASLVSQMYLTSDRIEIRSSGASDGIYFYSNGAVTPDAGITTSGLFANNAANLDRINVGSATGATTGQIISSDLIGPTISDSGTTNVPTGLLLRHTSSGTPANGFGIATKYQLKSSTTANQDAAQINVVWGTATHASRAGQMQFYAYDAAGARAFLIGSASGTAPMIGFLGASAVAQQSIGAAAPAGGTGTAAGGWDTAAHRDAAITLLNNMRTALLNFGLAV